jgi:UDP-N-acetylmuramoyl-L-alanyl-D-glutamate--2,6-diaminopimelate ligase
VRRIESLAIVRALQDAGLLRERRGEIPATVTNLTEDSREVRRGTLFVAVPGLHVDGHDFLAAAEKNGAALVIVEHPANTVVPLLVVNDARRAAAIAAAVFYDHPARSLRLASVTGTNGKSTTVGIARVVLDGTVGRAASLGTLGALVGRDGQVVPGGDGLTTPGPIELQRLLRTLADDGVKCIALEVSSHSLEQRRVEGLVFEVAAFTTFTRDHLDYHGTMEEYFKAKARLVDHLAANGTLVINADDSAWQSLTSSGRVITFGLNPAAAVHAESVRLTARGSEWTLRIGRERAAVRLPFIGDVNVSNALAAAAIAHAMGVGTQEIAAALNTAPQVPGRLEVLAESPLVLRDYAHTPDALERALSAVRRITPGRVIVVFGCGGDRDRGKRPIMGGIAARAADKVIVTSDNPRTEDPARIIDEIVVKLPASKYERVEDRREAIERALEIAEPEDAVLVAGKGHEAYQVRGNTRYPFDEKEIVGELMAVRG